MTAPGGGVIAGVDIGGTKVRVVTAGWDVPARGRRVVQVPTPRSSAGAVVDAVVAAVRAALGQPDPGLRACGVAAAGVIDTARGTVVSSTDSLPGWEGARIGPAVGASLGVPVVVENDCNALALAEAAAAGREDLLALAVGTGVGAGLVSAGRLVHGVHFTAGEIGHIRVPEAAGRPCPCGGVGHLEAAVAGRALAARWSDVRSPDDPGRLDDALAAGDPRAVGVVHEAAGVLGRALVDVVRVVDPGAVVLAGSVAALPGFLEGTRAAFAELAPAFLRGTSIRASRAGDDAVAAGALLLARRLLDDSPEDA